MAQNKVLPLGLIALGGLAALTSGLGAVASAGTLLPGLLLALAVGLLLVGAWGLHRGDALVVRAEARPAAGAPEAREALDALQEAPLLLLTCDERGRVVVAEGEALHVPPRSL
ncbi:MAG TPA: hypothetical protein VFO83_12155, partial [Aggregicoccus sp.]|nr:hypothetical protein [Aggregicoccus sp.]